MRELGFVEANPQPTGPPQTGSETQTIGALQTPGAGLTTMAGVTLSAVKEEKRACIDGVRAEPRYQKIVPHLPQVETGQFSILQLADERTPSRQEAQEFGAYIDEVRPCVEKSFQSFAAIIPGAGAILTEGLNESDAITVEFIHQQLTWGQLAFRLKQIDLSATVKISRLM